VHLGRTVPFKPLRLPLDNRIDCLGILPHLVEKDGRVKAKVLLRKVGDDPTLDVWKGLECFELSKANIVHPSKSLGIKVNTQCKELDIKQQPQLT